MAQQMRAILPAFAFFRMQIPASRVHQRALLQIKSQRNELVRTPRSFVDALLFQQAQLFGVLAAQEQI